MAQIPVINNHTGDEGTVDETWLERWPDDFTPLADRGEETPAAAPSPVEEPSDGNKEEI